MSETLSEFSLPDLIQSASNAVVSLARDLSLADDTRSTLVATDDLLREALARDKIATQSFADQLVRKQAAEEQRDALADAAQAAVECLADLPRWLRNNDAPVIGDVVQEVLDGHIEALRKAGRL